MALSAQFRVGGGKLTVRFALRRGMLERQSKVNKTVPGLIRLCRNVIGFGQIQHRIWQRECREAGAEGTFARSNAASRLYLGDKRC
jgi:hypothetical protein